MVTQITSLSRTGLSDWLIQRISSIILAVYCLFLVAFFITHPQTQYVDWHSLFQGFWMRTFSFLSLISLVAHSWVGTWTVLTDYIKPFRLRLFIQIIFILLLILCLAWGIQILWGI